MKRMFSSVAVTALIVGLVAVLPGSTATADPYTGTVPTTMNAWGKDIKKGQRVVTRANVKSGNGQPKGTLRVFYKRNKGGYNKSKAFTYRGGKRTMQGKKLNKPGKYTISVRYLPKHESVWQSSSDSYTLRVRRR
ncbi:hypothetical protein [Nocardioides sp.]|uniref:hypothetical protein n=1 Tax=Nocardioides sp. TaxID=35761 RepID=UPI0035666E83